MERDRVVGRVFAGLGVPVFTDFMVADVFAAVHEKNEQMDTSPVQTEWLAAHWAGVSVVYRAIAEDQRLAIPIYVLGDQLLTSGDEAELKIMIAVLVLIGLVVYGGYDYFHKSSSETGQIAKWGKQTWRRAF